MSNKPDNIQIKNKFAPTFDIQQQLDTINQQNLSNRGTKFSLLG